MHGAKNVKKLGDFNAGIEHAFVCLQVWYPLFFRVDAPFFLSVSIVTSMLSLRIITVFENLTVV